MPRPTPSQWEAIRHADRHVLVAAGAGTGKTATVVNRILYLLGVEMEGARHRAPVELRDIAAITFTNAAAADLKGKLRKALREAGLRDVACDVDGARIGTIHSFCGDILREFALRMSRSPVATVLEEGESAALLAEAVRETVIAALDEGRIDGLEDLFARWPVATVEGWMARLAGDADRLERLAKDAAAHGGLERTVVELSRLALERLAGRLDAAGAVDFDRMIVLTRDLIRNQRAVREALRRRIGTLIVDEFQDVDPAQRDIAYLLGDPLSGRADTTRLMLVGDPKQSIYRFRRADVTVWTAAEREFRAGAGLVVPLEENFRSVEPILGFVNAAIGPILDRPVSGDALQPFEIAFQPVRATRFLGPGDAAPRVELLVVPPGDDGRPPNAETVRKREAVAVARRMAELRDAGTRWGDMAVLLSAWGALDVYEGALRAAGVPTYALRVEGFYERREVLDVVLALEAIRDPGDDRALLGFLRSPFVGLRDETLLEIARGTPSPCWDGIGGVPTGEPELLARGVALLREHTALRDRIPTAELIERLIERSGYLAYLALLGDAGRQGIANLRKLARIARQMPERSVGDFLRVLAEVRARGDREGDERLFGPKDDVVTITSVHSAKGLEWDVVFWCDLVRGPNPSHRETILIGRDRIAVKDPDVEPTQQPVHWQRLKQGEEQEAAAERKRLWYVAATRAKERLVLSGIPLGAKEGCPAGAIQSALGDLPARDGARVRVARAGDAPFEILVGMVPPLPDGEETPAAAEPDVAHEELAARIPAPLPRFAAGAGRLRHSATEMRSFDRCERRHWFRYSAGLREPPVERSGAGFMDAIRRGQIVHDVLEHLAEEDELDALLEAAIGRWDEDAPAPETEKGVRYRSRLREEVELVRGDAAYAALAGAESARIELGFLYMADGEVYEGKLDLASRDAGGPVLLDVKTHQDGDDESRRKFVESYAIQRDLYVAAAEAIGGEPVSRFAFQLSRPPEQLSAPITPELREAGKRRLRALAERMDAEAASPAARRMAVHPAECRYCGYRSAGWCEGVKAPETAEQCAEPGRATT
jgi:ATP-dependent helicase/nuclease subunit A